jgi:uncharacterized protein YlzI (FlbEa/FlbD family)
VIAVTCRNGEHFALDPDVIERVETVPDTTLVLVDGSHYVVDASLEDILRLVRDHRAAAVLAREHLIDLHAATPAAVRYATRNRPQHPVGGAPAIRVVHHTDD